MQNTLLDFLDTSSSIKLGRCLSTGDLVLLPENTNTTLDTERNNSYEYLHFDPFLMFNELLSDKDVQKVLLSLPECCGTFNKTDYPEICFLAECIFNEFHTQNAHYVNSMCGLILALFAMISRTPPTNASINKSDSQLQTALLFIHNNYNTKLSVADIATNCCNMSESHFRRRFCELLHTSPLEYINALRIHKACQLIYHSELHINEIAESVGFTTLSSFNRCFQSLCGTSPTKWRKEHGSPVSQIRYTVE